MTRHATRLAVAILLALPLTAIAQPSPATDAHATGPLAAVDALFSAMARHDVTAARRLLMPGAKFLVIRADGDLHASDDGQFLDALGKDPKAAWKERIWSPQVQVDGAMAQVWAPYDFHLDGTFSHCGTDVFTLVHGTDGWRIAAIAYTARKNHCPAGG